MDQMVKNLPAMQETWVLSLGCEDPLEKGMVTHSSILDWRIPWTEEPEGLKGYSSSGHEELDMTEQLTQSLHDSCECFQCLDGEYYVSKSCKMSDVYTVQTQFTIIIFCSNDNTNWKCPKAMTIL